MTPTCCAGTAGPATTRSTTSRSPTRRAASASGSATRCSRRVGRRAGDVLAVVHGDGPATGARVARKATLPDRRAARRGRPVPAARRRRRADRPRHGGRASRTSRGSSRGSPRRRRHEHVHPLLRARQASPRRSSSCRTPTSRSPARSRFARPRARARRRARRPGAPVGLQARRALGVGALQRPAQPSRASRVPAPSSTACQRLRPALRARARARARRSSGASAASDFRSTSPLRVHAQRQPRSA